MDSDLNFLINRQDITKVFNEIAKKMFSKIYV